MKERVIHLAMVDWLRLALPPGAVVMTIPGGDGVRTMAPGYIKGTPDIIAIPPAHHGVPVIMVEVKGARGRVSPHQAQMIDRINSIGHVAVVARSIDEARTALVARGVPVRC